MAKKSFLNDNPAMAYITSQTETTQNTPDTDVTEHTYNTEHTHVTTNKRKQTKSARMQVLMTPALHNELTIIAHMQRISLNELVNRVMGEYVATKREQIGKYLTLVGDE